MGRAISGKDIARIFSEGSLIDDALAQGVREALRRHKQAGQPVAVWRDGKAVWVPAEEIDLPDDYCDHQNDVT